MKTRIAIAAVLAFAGAAMAQNGTSGQRGTLTLNGDWAADTLDIAGAPTEQSPWEFTLETPAYFRITDAFIVGDQYIATDPTHGLIGITSFAGPRPPTTFGMDSFAEPAWESGNYQTLETILAPGNYAISITGDGAGGLPAGLYVQLEKVPAPGAVALLGLGGLVAGRRRR
jgi:hypothetical protein